MTQYLIKFDDGDMDFPVGTVFVKNFEVASTLVETSSQAARSSP